MSGIFGIERRERLRIGVNRERKVSELDTIWTRRLCKPLKYKETPKVRILHFPLCLLCKFLKKLYILFVSTSVEERIPQTL